MSTKAVTVVCDWCGSDFEVVIPVDPALQPDTEEMVCPDCLEAADVPQFDTISESRGER